MSRAREAVTFLAVGGTGYVVDVAAFNFFRDLGPFATLDPAVARSLAVVVAMMVTYVGNRTFTWSDHAVPRGSAGRQREIGLFVLLNVIGFGFSVVTLMISHDLFGWTSRLADNLSANVVGMALGTAFRFWSYRRFVFVPDVPRTPETGQIELDRSSRAESA